MISVVNMIPNSWSDEENQDCEPCLSVNPANPSEMIATAFTYDNPAGTSAVSPAMSTAWAPLYYSTDGGQTWTLQNVMPSGVGAILPTFDVTARFGGTSGAVYTGLISSVSSNIVINRAPNATTTQPTIVTISGGDQPFAEATTALGGGASGDDHVYVGYNSSALVATVDQSQNAATAPAPAGFAPLTLDSRGGEDGPKTRATMHADGTVYIVFYSGQSAGTDVVVVKDLNWGYSTPPYAALTDPGDHKTGVRVATNISVGASGSEDADFGNDRRGWELAICVDPNNDQRVYLCYNTGTSAADYTLHLRESVDGGKTWSTDKRTIVKAKNPGVAINLLGEVGFLYQQVTGPDASARWQTIYEHSATDFASYDSHTLADVPATTPTPSTSMATYIGDYVKLLAVGKNFYGVFSANNTPTMANFPSGVTFQRNVDMATGTLLGTDNTTPVAISIDPFFFSSTGIAASVDFYVRDWIDSPTSYDTGVEPSTHPVFYTTSDVWNQRSNATPTFNANNQPDNQDPQIASMGSNYAYARVSRRAPAPSGSADVTVTAEFLFADFGLGVAYADLLPSATTTLDFHAADNQLITAGVPWTLPATHSQHVCLAVQISSPSDPYQQPSLRGRSPGWPDGTDTTVLNDNNKAQRNLGIFPVGQSAAKQKATMFVYALLHNAATQTRDMEVQYAGGVVEGVTAREVSVAFYGQAAQTLTAGHVLTAARMLPGENRWLGIAIPVSSPTSAPTYHDFYEVVAGRTLSGFRVTAQVTAQAAFIAANVVAERALLARHAALFSEPLPAVDLATLEQLTTAPDPALYTSYLRETALAPARLAVLAKTVHLTSAAAGVHQTRVTAALTQNDVIGLAAAHAGLLYELDALTTMAQKAAGDANDILVDLSWLRAIYARARLPQALIDDVRSRAQDFILAFAARTAGPADVPALVHGLGPDLAQTASALGGQLPALVAAVGTASEPDAAQRALHAYLTALDALIPG
jgi:hypothetical protein